MECRVSGGFAPVRRKAYGEQITEQLREAIVRGELPVGQRLVEEQLAAQFGVSRGPIRDALRRLEVESLVESRGSGTYVIGISETDIDELYSLRQAVENLAASLAMDRCGEDDWREMATVVEALHEAADRGDRESFASADVAFHSAIYALSGHRRLADVWSQYAPMLTTLLRTTVLVRTDLHESADKHALLLRLMTSGDHAAVAEELRGHLEQSHASMLAAHKRIRPGQEG
jgi:GntR family transcriptional regulator of gluconate operon